LQEALHLRGGKQVHAARNVRDALARVIDNDGNQIARRRLLAQDDDIPPTLGFARNRARAAVCRKFGERKRRAAQLLAGALNRARHVEPQGIGFATRFALFDVSRCASAPQTRIDEPAVRIGARRLGSSEDIGARGKARIDEPHRRETFRSRVTLDKPKLQILVEYLDGPFSKMQNRWTFKPAGDNACTVEFFIDYEFKSRMLGMLMGAMFDTAFRRFAEAFEKRADVIYGRKTA